MIHTPLTSVSEPPLPWAVADMEVIDSNAATSSIFLTMDVTVRAAV
jgi:hypothetical protein